MTAEEKVKQAADAYLRGCTCSQAVMLPYAGELGIDEVTVYKIMEGFGGGFGAMQEVCGAFSAVTAVISYKLSSGSMDGKSKMDTYKAIRRAAEIYKDEYGSIRCYDILRGNSPKGHKCSQKVMDAVMTIERTLDEFKKNDA